MHFLWFWSHPHRSRSLPKPWKWWQSHAFLMILEPSAPLPLTSKTMKMMTVPCLYNGFTVVFNAPTMVFSAFTMAVCMCASCATRDPWTVVGDAWLSRCSRGLSRCSRGRMSQPLSFCRILEHWLVCWLAWWRLLADSSRLPASGENRMTANLLGSTDLYGRGGWVGKAMKSNEKHEKQWKAMKSNEKTMKSNEK